jgi:hypothetical protein
MNFSKDYFRRNDKLIVSPLTPITKSDTIPTILNGFYPRGFRVLTGGTLTIWAPDPSDDTKAVKIDFGTVQDGFEWTYGNIVGIAATAEDNETPVSCDNIIPIP